MYLMSTLSQIKNLLAWLSIALSAHALAQPVELNASLNETVVQIPKPGLFTVELETTIYLPDGAGPFPIALINHGKAFGDPRFQSRYRPALAARYFLQRGYAVVVPMRQGFSKSGGRYIGGGCNIDSNGRAQASDVKAVLDYVTQQAWADKQRMVVLGQSHGGWTTLAFGAQNYPGVRALVNFAGGLRQDGCAGWQAGLARSAAAFAKETTTPSLWFYGDNDSYFSPATFRPMFESYTAAGGAARLVAFGSFGADAHAMFGATAGVSIWQPEVSKFLASVELPSEPLPAFSKFGTGAVMPRPPKTDLAELGDASGLPHVNEQGREGYKTYLAQATPLALARVPTGAWAWADGGDDPMQRTVENCKRNAKTDCKRHLADDAVVWTQQP